MTISHPYDDVADRYDAIWSTPEALAEDRQVMERIAYAGGDVLDIGCGTGLFLDHYPECTDYVGIDPSQAMLDRLISKHPDRLTLCRTFEKVLPALLNTCSFDLIISLFGSPSYIEPDALDAARNLLRPNGKMIFMFIAPNYTPVTHDYISNPPKLLKHHFARYGSVSQFGNYIITES